MSDIEFENLLYEQLEQTKYYLLKMGANIQDAEDTIQETAYKFLTYMDSVSVENVEGWLFRVAVNHYYDLCRAKKRRRKILMKFDYEEMFDDFTPEKAAIQKEVGSEIYVLLEKLKPQYAQFLILKYSTGLKLSEIASLYDMKVESVKTILFRARKQFMEIYRRYQDR